MTAAKRMITVVSQKGGVGKTTFARALVDAFRARGKLIAAWDGDSGVGGLVKCLGQRGPDGKLLQEQDPIAGVGYYDVRREERSGLLNCIALGHEVILQDLAGGSLVDASRVVDDGSDDLSGFLDALDSRGYRLTVAHLLINDLEAAASVGAWLEASPPDRCDHLAVLNCHFGRKADDFPFWIGYLDSAGAQRGGGNRKRLLGSGGAELLMPAIPPSTYAKMDALNLPPTAAAASPLLTVVEQAHAAKFCRDFALQVAIGGERLGWSV